MSNTTNSNGISIEFNNDIDDEDDNVGNTPDVPMNSKILVSNETKPQSVCIVSKPSISTPVSILIESLIKKICMIYETDNQQAEIMYKVICDKLYDMNLIGESYTMNEFESIRSQYQRALLHLLASVKNGDKNLPISPIWPKSDFNSHYHREFEEVEYIAGGGFGQVYKVKHKLDGTEYAVKKIPILSEGIQSVRNYLSEVKTFASMNHSNIVQYKGAWLEIGPPKSKAIVHKDTESFTSASHQTGYIYHKDTSQSFTKNDEDSTDFQIDFEHSVSGASSVKSKASSRKKRKSLSEGEEEMAVCKLDLKEIERIKAINKTKVKWATLYIQMALCQSTLKQWLEKRNCVTDPNKAVVPKNEQIIRNNSINQILIQLLNGLEYIHSKGIVHHDIKPSNIFIQVDNGKILIQLGDFGLACPLQSVRHSLAFGTKLYAAPEQLAGKCDKKSDMYSLGIVIFELVENFNTDMERVRYITDLRKGHIPSNVLVTYPHMSEIIQKLMNKNPDLRPDTTTLLETLKCNENEQIGQLKMQLAEKDEEILHLKELLKMHGIKSLVGHSTIF
ncbi:probable serine/threonine-protein kinase ifkC isoform X1 [Diorhabda sublineata]|uniref:probable serine/threonine-protein kinase ifkC isoform X1 n=1 Tax=Diorhabda sublineata TaxID=1163346 RepID=UPI0024E07035|nr:probable serine/threonine-protein kinase ifkC isoform X1 [Diorhabda sublineata]